MAKRAEGVPELLVGIAVLCGIGWMIARAYQVNAAASSTAGNGPLPQPATTLSQGQQYFWPGAYSSSGLVIGTPVTTTTPGLSAAGNGIVMPPLQQITIPPATPFNLNAAGAPTGAANCNCGCISGDFYGSSGNAAAPQRTWTPPMVPANANGLFTIGTAGG